MALIRYGNNDIGLGYGKRRSGWFPILIASILLRGYKLQYANTLNLSDKESLIVIAVIIVYAWGEIWRWELAEVEERIAGGIAELVERISRVMKKHLSFRRELSMLCIKNWVIVDCVVWLWKERGLEDLTFWWVMGRMFDSHKLLRYWYKE